MRHGLRRCEVVAPAWDDIPHATARIRDVGRVARNDVQVQVLYSLPSGGVDVDADVVAVGRVMLLDLRPRVLQRADQRASLVSGCVEEGRDVSAGNDERMAGRYGKF